MDAAETRPPTHVFKSDADWELVKLVAKRDSLPKGISDELLHIFSMGGLTFRSTYHISEAIRELKGADFETHTILLRPLPDSSFHSSQGAYVEYVAYIRPLIPLLRDTLDAYGNHLRKPVLQGKDTRINDHLVNAEEYQRLLTALRDATGDPTALLLPVVFHSGASIVCACVCMYARARVCMYVHCANPSIVDTN